MSFPRLGEIEQELSRTASGLSKFSCAVLRNITVEGMEPYLRYAGRRDGLELLLNWGDYDNVLQEASGGGSGVVTSNLRAIIVFLWLPAFSELLGFTFPRATSDQVRTEIDRVREYCTATLRSLRQRSSAPILWMGFEPPAWPSYGISDASLPTSHRKAIAELNELLVKELVDSGNAWLVDTTQCLERLGAGGFYDWRYWHMAHAPFSLGAMAELSSEIAKYLRAFTGKVRKCLVLDCDNTLWGGIVGEEGIDGIHIGTEYPGSAFRDFQHEVLNLYHRGVILALCSKNNEDDVLEVFRSRREMVLREEHFSVMRINWKDKAANLQEIASELNIGLDSLVFVDDSEFEINLVRAALPEVETVLLPHDKSAESRVRLASCGWFDTLTLTEEDRMRGRMYRAEVERKVLRTQTMDLREYLQSLGMKLLVQEVGEGDLDRVAQLCHRSNQFNLTTKRYTREELADYAGSPSNILLLLKLSDRFGDHGIVGFCMTMVKGTEAIFDTFLISCRVLGRGVETAFLSICADAAARRGGWTLKGCYIPTKKNSQVSNFYERHGFDPLNDEGDERWFKLAWSSACIVVPEHFSIIEQTGTK